MTSRLLLAAFLALAGPSLAAEPAKSVSTVAADGLTLRGTWHASARPTGRAVLALHEMCSNRGAWAPFLEPLLSAGIDVLAVDLRGFGETGGKMEWEDEVADVGAWMAFLRAQPGVQPERVGILGESLGAKLALVGCSRDPRCRAAAALSPYGAFTPADLDFTDRAVFVVGTRGDDVRSALAVRRIAAEVRGDVTIRLVPGSEPGVATAIEPGMDLVPEFARWLDRSL